MDVHVYSFRAMSMFIRLGMPMFIRLGMSMFIRLWMSVFIIIIGVSTEQALV